MATIDEGRWCEAHHDEHEIDTTRDGMLAMFSAPAPAVRCAGELRSSALKEGLHVRVGVHVGEVELVGGRGRGLAVHEAARPGPRRLFAVADGVKR